MKKQIADLVYELSIDESTHLSVMDAFKKLVLAYDRVKEDEFFDMIDEYLILRRSNNKRNQK